MFKFILIPENVGTKIKEMGFSRSCEDDEDKEALESINQFPW